MAVSESRSIPVVKNLTKLCITLVNLYCFLSIYLKGKNEGD